MSHIASVLRRNLLPRVYGGCFPYFNSLKDQSLRPYSASIHSAFTSSDTAVNEILQLKLERNLTFEDIAHALGYTNVYTAQLLLFQAPLNPSKASALRNILGVSESTIEQMVKSPNRRFDRDIAQEPHVYRMLEACQHNGQAMKMIINEKFGDGIMSAIDFYINIEKIKGKANEDRVLITFNGKFLPFIEQNIDECRQKN